jgi:hypothetical protein
VEPVNEDPTLQDVWRLLGAMNRRLGEMNGRFDAIERQFVALSDEVNGRIANLDAKLAAGFGALKSSIEARDFRLDEHARRLAELEAPR